MWKSISSQQEICPSSLASRACLSHRRRPSTSSLVASTPDTPSNKWLIWHGDLFSEVCLCALFSLMRSASLITAPGIPRFAGPSPKEEGDSKKRLRTHMTLTDIKRPQAITSSDRRFVYISSISRMVWKVSVLKHRVLYDTLVLGSWRIRDNSIHRCAQKGDSQKGNSVTFVITEFSEVRTLSWCYGAHTA